MPPTYELFHVSLSLLLLCVAADFHSNLKKLLVDIIAKHMYVLQAWSGMGKVLFSVSQLLF